MNALFHNNQSCQQTLTVELTTFDILDNNVLLLLSCPPKVYPLYNIIFDEDGEQAIDQEVNADVYTAAFATLCEDPTCALEALLVVNEQCDAGEAEEDGLHPLLVEYLCKVQDDVS